MFTTAELDNYINEVAHKYLKEAIPLNDSITKLASDHGLNRDQIARVVEGANTEVYVQLMNNTTDKYIQFDNASLDKVANSVFETEKQAKISGQDYEEEPRIEVTDSVFEKLASVEEKIFDENMMVKKAYALASLNERLVDSMYEIDVRFQNNSDVMYDLIKQAYLEGTSFGDIKRAIDMVYDSKVVDKVLGECQEKIAQEIYPRQLDMAEKTAGSVNTDNPLIRQANILVKDTQEYLTLREKIADVQMEMNKLAEEWPHAKIYFGTFKKTGADVTKAAPLLTKLQKGLLIGTVGGAGGYALKSHMEDTRKKQMGMPMLPGAGRVRG